MGRRGTAGRRPAAAEARCLGPVAKVPPRLPQGRGRCPQPRDARHALSRAAASRGTPGCVVGCAVGIARVRPVRGRPSALRSHAPPTLGFRSSGGTPAPPRGTPYGRSTGLSQQALSASVPTLCRAQRQ
ncbi:hypothetical protein FNH04_16995 [Streptomyces phyllanthi]|uniref:Uncharacterized protein n=1 Tax=Streptomyces phyllanthi TaxID=1803180 RepID=A0A5N8W5D1_9ACTN|nr:hypothetical protein [Streptomyces phyllanthi]